MNCAKLFVFRSKKETKRFGMQIGVTSYGFALSYFPVKEAGWLLIMVRNRIRLISNVFTMLQYWLHTR